MTIGERIAWIWAWSAMVVLSVALAFAAWRYWGLPSAYFDAFLCQGHRPLALAACDRISKNEDAPVSLRSDALRRLVDIERTSHESRIERLSLLVRLGGANSEDLNKRGLSYYSLRQFDKAAEDFRAASAMNDAVGIYWSNLGDAEIELRIFDQAYEHYTTAIENSYETAEVLGNRGWASYQLGKDERALADYVQAIARDPQHSDNLNERGLVRHALGEYESALSDFDRALALRPDNAVILTNRAITHARLGNAARSRQDIDRAITLDSKYGLAHLQKAWLLIDGGESGAALSELRIVESLGPLDIPALEARARAHYNQGLRQEAIADAEKAMAMNNQYDWPYQLRSEVRQNLYDYEGSIADSSVILKRSPVNIDALITRSTSLQLSGDFKAALADMNRAIEIDPAYAYENRSYLNIYAGRLAEAVSDAQKSVALAPQSSETLTALGWAHVESGAPAAGLLECGKSLSIRESERALRCRAIAHLLLNQLEEALADANRALSLNQNSANNQIVLGRIELAQGNPSSALARFDEALKQLAFDRAAAHMFRGDAERALGEHAKARLEYQEAQKRDLGLYTKALAERLASLPAQ